MFVGAQGDVLHAGAVVVLDVLLDLALLETLGRFVDRHHDLAAVPHHRRHQRRVLGADLLVVEVQQLGEAHHVGVEVDPRVELALGDVADDVVDGDEADVGADVRVGELVVGVPRLECRTAVAQTVDERVHRLAVGGHLGQFEVAVLVTLDPRLAHAARPAGEGGRIGSGGIVDEPGEIVNAVAVAAHVIGDRRVGRQGAGHDPADVALFEDVARLVAPPGLRTGIAGAAEAEVRTSGSQRWYGRCPTQNSMQSQPRRCRAGVSRASGVARVSVALIREANPTVAVWSTSPDDADQFAY